METDPPDSSGFMASLGGLMDALVRLLLIALMEVWRGYVLTILWAWFVMPQFGVAALSLTIAIGLALIADLLRSQSDEAARELREIVTTGVFAPAAMLLCGWIVTKFM